MEPKKKSVRYVTKRIILMLDQATKPDVALLAALRNSAGKSLNDASDVWPFLFENLPEEFLSTNGQSTYEEKAIFTALQLYAICKQGASGSVKADEEYKYTIGASLRSGRSADTQQALDRRFNAMITSSTFDELSYHLRQMIRLVKAKAGMTINFSKLADDLFWYQCGDKKKVIFRWATDYYRSQPKEENE